MTAQSGVCMCCDDRRLYPQHEDCRGVYLARNFSRDPAPCRCWCREPDAPAPPRPSWRAKEDARLRRRRIADNQRRAAAPERTVRR